MKKEAKKEEIERFEKFLSSWGRHTDSHVDVALIAIMDKNKDAIAPLFAARDAHWLHKAFRQVGVCDDGFYDAVIWNLIHASKDFWDEVTAAFENTPRVQREKQLKRELRIAEDRISLLEEEVKKLREVKP